MHMTLKKREIIRGDGVPEDDAPTSPPETDEDSIVKRKLKYDKLNPNSPYGKMFRKAIKNKRLFKY